MVCPLDNSELKMSDRQGIEIDYCPKCRGVWLDRGELDKIVAKLNDTDTSRYQDDRRDHRYERDHDDYEDDEGGFNFGRDRNDRRGGFLNNLFDIGE